MGIHIDLKSLFMKCVAYWHCFPTAKSFLPSPSYPRNILPLLRERAGVRDTTVLDEIWRPQQASSSLGSSQR